MNGHYQPIIRFQSDYSPIKLGFVWEPWTKITPVDSPDGGEKPLKSKKNTKTNHLQPSKSEVIPIKSHFQIRNFPLKSTNIYPWSLP